VERLVQEAKAEPVLPVVDDGLRRPERIGDARHEVPARREVVVDRPRHPEQLFPALGGEQALNKVAPRTPTPQRKSEANRGCHTSPLCDWPTQSRDDA
jgi:hypothetical protein